MAPLTRKGTHVRLSRTLQKHAAVATAFFLILFLASISLGATLDPKLKWQTIETQHFIIHYYKGEELIAGRVAEIAEPIFERVTKAIGWVPKKQTHVVLTDETDAANGFAVTAPNNMIRLFVTAPKAGSSLEFYTDWLEMLLTHELTHIVHIDTIGGLPKILRSLFGSVVDYNQMQPRWIVEGYATHTETQLTTGGRGAATSTDMLLRAAVLEDAFPSISQANGEMASWPSGFLPYLFGVAFHQWLYNTYGEEKIREYNQKYASSLIPYRLNATAKKTFGKSWIELWGDWHQALKKQYKQEADQVTAAGLTEPERLTHHGRRVGGARFSPSGDRIAYSSSDGNGPATIRLMDPDGSNSMVLLEKYYSEALAWSPDGKRIAFGSQALYKDFYSWTDIFTVNVEAKSIKAITSGVRGRDPEYKPDGSEIIFVANNLSNNDLAVARIDETIRYLTDNRDFTQYSTPRFSPSGKQLAVGVWQPGGYRDILLLSPDAQNSKRVTADLHMDRDPTWAPDGRHLIFSSDRSGISNLYAYDTETARYYRVTNLLTGAFQPSISPDSKWIIFQGYHSKGYDLYKIPYSPEDWTEVGWDYDSAVYGVGCTTPEPAPSSTIIAVPPNKELDTKKKACGPGLQVPRKGKQENTRKKKAATPKTTTSSSDKNNAPEATSETTNVVELGKSEDVEVKTFPLMERPKKSEDIDLSQYDPKPYSPMKTLFPPRYWLPAQFYFTESGVVAGAFTGGMDPLFRHSYSAWVNYNSASQFVGGGMRYWYDRYYPTYYFGADAFSIDYGSSLARSYGQRPNDLIGVYSLPSHYFERRMNAFAGFFWPYKKRHFLGLRYLFENRSNLNPLPTETYEPFVPVRGNFGSINFGYTFSHVDYYRMGISPTQGYRVAATLKLAHPSLGSNVNHPSIKGDYEKAVATVDLRGYPKVPGTQHHVLALRAVGGIAAGDTFFPPTFRLGGALGESSLVVATSNYYALRGYPYFSFLGEAFAVTSAEYRFPISRVERGFGTWPIFLRQLHGALFADVGDSWYWESGDTPSPHIGVGAELRGNFNFFYYFPLTMRLGYAIGLQEGGYQGGIFPLYLMVGASF